MKLQLAPLEGLSQRVEELPAEQTPQDANRQEEPWSAGRPLCPVECDATTRDDAVDVRMVKEIRAPRVQHGQKTDVCAQVFRVAGNLAQRTCGTVEQDLVHDGLVLKGYRRDLLRDRKDNVEVLDWEQLSLPLSNPPCSRQLLTLGAMPIPAGVVSDLLVATLVALLNVSARCSCPASDETSQYSTLSTRDATAPGNSKISLVGSNDVGHLEARAAHSDAVGQPAVSGRSSGLRVARSSLVDTCV